MLKIDVAQSGFSIKRSIPTVNICNNVHVHVNWRCSVQADVYTMITHLSCFRHCQICQIYDFKKKIKDTVSRQVKLRIKKDEDKTFNAKCEAKKQQFIITQR